ncbi:MAG: hypothetical protein EBQ51_08790 [Verrucomicrobia bacterium]|nr:hypothetical protein [Pseudomonadota bacterium]NBS07108.1 hypothetical protein [Verrucomicrobiota bacterium]NBS79295.1 hypothetical protein [bacterium]NBS50323.1 hypothetical protein [Verrucomicrobiota bacterium]NBT24365.1 hypothetical protein [bacterium]
MKTAYELAMERLSSKEPTRKLTDSQKKSLADIDSTYRAKMAERETFLGAKIAAARAGGAQEEAVVLQEELARDLRGIREEWDRKKEQARLAR